MAKLDLTKEKIEVISGKDGIVIRKHLTGIEGGRNLDVTNYTEDVIPAGVVVITNGKGLYKPLVPTVTDGVASYTLPEGYKYVGIVECSILKTKSAAILTSGVVNESACPFPITDAVKSALPLIQFVKDETEVEADTESTSTSAGSSSTSASN